MGRIQSSIGLITGVPIADTVEQLIGISAQPRDRLIERNAQLAQQQVAVTELTALTVGLQFQFQKLGTTEAFEQKTASSNSSRLGVTVTGTPTPDTYQYTPVRQSQAQQLISSGFSDTTSAIGTGTLKFRFGGFVDRGLNLTDLNGGNGVQRGEVRLTDRSGESAIVDLRFARSVDDVIDAINSQSSVRISAVAQGDQIKLIDNTGQTNSNLRVEEVGLGTTAADLGLGGIDVATNEAIGTDIVQLFDGLALAQLNDGNGIDFGPTDDLSITFRDGSTLSIDLTSGGTPTTLGDVVDKINAADPAKLSAKISASGDSIELTDLVSGGGSFTVANASNSFAADGLGIATSVAADTITSRRLLSDLKSSLLSSLGGGKGIENLATIDITDRAGQSDTVDLSSAQTLDDVVRQINAAANAQITARINDSRNGIVLEDKSGGTGNLIVANGAGNDTADRLKIAVNSATSAVDSGSLDLQVISANTTLASLNNGRGVQEGSFTITDTDGNTGAINLAVLAATDVGEVIDAINALGISVVAEINDTGDGIRLRDTAFGSGSISVVESGSGTAAVDLKLAGTSTSIDIGGTQTHVIDGATTFSVTIDSDDTLADLVEKINELDAEVTASTFNEGSGATPHRLSLVSNVSGQAGEILIDTSQAGFSFDQLQRAQDALLLVGSADLPGAGILVSSSTNEFDGVLEGAKLTVNGTTTDPVTVIVEETSDQVASDIKVFVEQFNRLRDKIDELTFFSELDNSTGILFGSLETLRIESGLANLVTGRFFGAGSIRSLAELGLSLDDKGKLQFDESRFESKTATDADAVKEFFTTAEVGIAARFDALIESLAGEENSLLVNRATSLQQKLELNAERIDDLNARLDRERDRLLNEFFRMEQVIGQLQSNLSVIESIQPIAPLVSTG